MSQPDQPDELPTDLPHHLVFVRSTPDFTPDDVPAGLLREHRVALGVWGVLRVLDGTVRYVREDTGDARVVGAGEHQVIPPGVPHHVEPGPGSRLRVEFHRAPTDG